MKIKKEICNLIKEDFNSINNAQINDFDVKTIANNFSTLVRLLFTINKRRKEAENV